MQNGEIDELLTRDRDGVIGHYDEVCCVSSNVATKGVSVLSASVLLGSLGTSIYCMVIKQVSLGISVFGLGGVASLVLGALGCMTAAVEQSGYEYLDKKLKELEECDVLVKHGNNKLQLD